MAMLGAVGFGGGTGLPVLLKALGTIPEIEATAIVTVTDNGGSGSRSRQSFGIPAIGDLRNCLVALSGADCVLADVFQHRFSASDGLGEHSPGNLIVPGLCQRTVSHDWAITMMSRLLPPKGRALPTTGTHATLCAELTDGTKIRCESQISAADQRIEAHLGRGVIQFCIGNSLTRLARGCSQNPGSEPVLCNSDQIAAIGRIPVEEDLTVPQAGGIHHDPAAFGRLVWEISRGWISQTVYRREPDRAMRDFSKKLREPVCLNQ